MIFDYRREVTMGRLLEAKGFLLLFLIFTVFAGLATAVNAAPKKVATAKAGDCVVCHGKDKILPVQHPDTKSLNYTGCLDCHAKSGPQKLEGKIPASHIHGLSGVACSKCHGKTKKEQEVEMKQCVTCHNTDRLAEKTAKVKPQNPHESPHYGTTLDCNLCHHQHNKSENYCSQCH